MPSTLTDVRPKKRVIALLPPDLYERLEEQARREDRVADQQATYLLRRALTETNERSELAPS